MHSLEHERYYGSGMDALVTVCTRNTNAIMDWEKNMVWGMDALVTVCTRNTNVSCLSMDALVTVCTRNTNGIWSGHGCTCNHMHSEHERYMVWAWTDWCPHALEHERYYGLGMDALAIRCLFVLSGEGEKP